MRLLLDTQIFLWFIMGNDRLKNSWRILIENPSNRSFLSIASLWEIAIKNGLGKLSLQTSFRELVENQVESRGFSILPINAAHLIELEKLPHHHRDPFDRLIIAQSISEGLSLISSDPEFDPYPIIKMK